MRSLRLNILSFVAVILSYDILSEANDGFTSAQQRLGPSRHDITSTRDPFTSELKDFINELLQDWKAPGLSIAVVDGDEVYSEGFGFAVYPDTPTTPETLYYVGSTTKAHLAATLAHLIDSKVYPQLSRGWQTPISSVIRDDFVLADEWMTEHLTLEDAVSHRTGLSRHDRSWHAVKDGKLFTVKDTVRSLRNLPPPTVEPRTEWHYNNLMFVTLSHVVETLTGKALKHVLQETLWGPLGMNTTYLDEEEAKNAPVTFAHSYTWHNETEEYEDMGFFPSYFASGAGGAISSVLDYAKWIKCLISETEPLTKSVHQDIRKPRIIQKSMPDALSDVVLYGLGWLRTTIRGHVAYWHNGSTLTYGADVYWFPELKYGVIAVANSNSFSNDVTEAVVRRLIEDKLNIPLEERVDVDKRNKEAAEQAVRNVRDAVDLLYPDKSKPVIPSPVDTSKLAGRYEHQAYGSLNLYTSGHPRNKNETILVADLDELLFKTQFQLHHVSGSYWVAYILFPGLIERDIQFSAAEFNLGVDGEATGLRIEYTDRWSDLSDGPATYIKAKKEADNS